MLHVAPKKQDVELGQVEPSSSGKPGLDVTFSASVRQLAGASHLRSGLIPAARNVCKMPESRHLAVPRVTLTRGILSRRVLRARPPCLARCGILITI